MQPAFRRVSSLPSRARPTRTAASTNRHFEDSSALSSGDEHYYSQSEDDDIPVLSPDPPLTASGTSPGKRGGAGGRKGGRKKDSGDEEYKPPSKPPKPSRSPLRSPITELKKHLSRPSLKRDATSPVYLDSNSIAVASIPSSARRVAQCVSSRLRSSGSDVASIASSPDAGNSPRNSGDSPPEGTGTGAAGKRGGKEDKKRAAKGGVQRNKWTAEETAALVRGCNEHGIGQWKAIRDGDPILARRSPGDLKDRFRTYYPDAYRTHYPNARTHMSDRQRSKDKDGRSIFGENAHRRERKQFSAAEDDALRKGYAKYGTAWSSIARDPVLANRKSTDLRDRFRNAFPDLYFNSNTPGGYKARTRKLTADLYSMASDNLGYTPGFSFGDPNASMYPTYTSRAMEASMREQLPPLNFLKQHGADAFNFRENYYIGESSELSSTDDHHAPAFRGFGVVTTTTPKPGSIMTPRPPNHTPRPSDTTPRPRGSHVAGMVCPQLAGVPELPVGVGPPGMMGSSFEIAPVGSLDPSMSQTIVPTEVHPFRTQQHPAFIHKAQSSVDLSQFSHLNIGLAGIPTHSASPSPGPGSSGYRSNDNSNPQSPESGQPAELHFPEFLPYSRGSHNYSSPELGGQPGRDGAFSGAVSQPGMMIPFGAPDHLGGANMPAFGGGNGLISGEWGLDLDGASHAFPTAFNPQQVGFSSFNGIVNMPDANSSVSSLQSSVSDNSFASHSSSTSDHDHVLYTASDQAHLLGMTAFSPPSVSPGPSLSSAAGGAQETLFPGASPASEPSPGGFGIGGVFKEPE